MQTDWGQVISPSFACYQMGKPTKSVNHNNRKCSTRHKHFFSLKKIIQNNTSTFCENLAGGLNKYTSVIKISPVNTSMLISSKNKISGTQNIYVAHPHLPENPNIFSIVFNDVEFARVPFKQSSNFKRICVFASQLPAHTLQIASIFHFLKPNSYQFSSSIFPLHHHYFIQPSHLQTLQSITGMHGYCVC